MRKFLKRSTLRLHSERMDSLRELNFADLLERDVVSFQKPALFAALQNQTILVTGAAGSIGSELCRQLLDHKPKKVIALDTNETGLFDLAEGIHEHPDASSLHLSIGDVTDNHGISKIFAKERIDIVFHAAAYKHVPLLEHFPNQAVRTNILATYRLCRLAQEYKVKRFVFISTDKAAEPVSVMGASKRVAEMIVQTFAQASKATTAFCAVRFGNVIGSRGSVVPIFTRQIERGGPVTVTDPEATRYFMTIPEACGLVILAGATAHKGIYLLDMGNAVRIIDLATKMIRLRGLALERDISIVYTGLRPGERLHETLIASNEKLTPTAYAKIFSITSDTPALTLSRVVHWINALEHSLYFEENEQIREQLFALIHERTTHAIYASETADLA